MLIDGPGAASANWSISMSPLEFPAAKIGRRPVRPQIRTALTGPSLRNSGREVVMR